MLMYYNKISNTFGLINFINMIYSVVTFNPTVDFEIQVLYQIKLNPSYRW